MSGSRSLMVTIAVGALLVSCGSDSSLGESAPASAPSVTLPAASDQRTSEPTETNETVAAGETPASVPATADGRLVTDTPLPRSQTVQLAQPAIWPASDVVFDTPEAAAESYVSVVLGVDPLLGEFLGGDSRSGEISVFSPGDGGSSDQLERGGLALRMIGPNDGWFVIGAGSPGVSIDSPETLDVVAAGPLVITGQGRGFEGTLVVSAFRAGETVDELDSVITSGGAFGTLEPYSVTLDLSDATAGEVIALMVRGDTGLEGDPGDFASIPVSIGDPLPETR